MFSGLMSRCTMPASCAAARAAATCCATSRASLISIRVRCQVLAERFAFDVFRGDKVVPLVLADLMNGEDIRMIQAGGGLRLTLETAKTGVVASEFPWEQLDRDKTTESGVLCQVHFPHTAGAEQGADRVTSKTSPDRKGHTGFARPILCVNYAPSGRQLILATPLLAVRAAGNLPRCRHDRC